MQLCNPRSLRSSIHRLRRISQVVKIRLVGLMLRSLASVVEAAPNRQGIQEPDFVPCTSSEAPARKSKAPSGTVLVGIGAFSAKPTSQIAVGSCNASVKLQANSATWRGLLECLCCRGNLVLAMTPTVPRELSALCLCDIS